MSYENAHSMRSFCRVHAKGFAR